LEGDVTKTLLRLAWPIIVSSLFQTSFNIADTIFVGRVGPNALAAVSLTFPVGFFFFAIGNGAAIGVTSLIARSIGAGDMGKVSNVANHSLLLIAILGISGTLTGIIWGRNIFELMRIEEDILELSWSYMRIIFAGMGTMFIAVILEGVLRGEGDMKTAMRIIAIAITINIILDPILIFGLGPFPRMGVAGAALATVIARVIGCFILALHFIRGRSSIKFNLKEYSYDSSIIKDIVRVGLPTTISMGAMSISMGIINSMIIRFSSFAMAAWGVTGRLSSIAFLPALGISVANTTLVGQNYGAKKYDRVESSAFIGAKLAFLFMFSIGAIFFLFPDLLVGIFNRDPEVLRYGREIFRITTIGYGFIGVSILMGGSFQGLGRGTPALIVSLFRIGVIYLPAAYLLAFTYGLKTMGIWIAMVLGDVIASLVAVGWFTRTINKIRSDYRAGELAIAEVETASSRPSDTSF